MKLITILTITLLVFIVKAEPSVLSSEYRITESDLLDVQYKHAVFDLKFDDDIYYPENWSCGCTSNVQSSCSATQLPDVTLPEYITPSALREIIPVKSESRSLSSDSDENGWVENILTSGEYHYYYFDVNQSDYVGCPIISLDLFTNVGSVSIYASTLEFPNSNKFQWSKISYQKEGWWICPDMIGWGWVVIT